MALKRQSGDDFPVSPRKRSRRRSEASSFNDARPLTVPDHNIEILPDFIHTPLGGSGREIRVLEILSRDTDGVSCRLTHHSLDRCQYFALSYTWGSAGDLCAIEVNGAVVCIQKNLFTFLQHALVTDKMLWIDAICIDQWNVNERNHQVGLMSEIYSKAKGMLLWLGDGDASLEHALNVISGDHHAREAHEHSSGIRRRLWEPTTCSPPSSAVRTAWVRLCTLPYWRRLWIVQEAVLAQDIMVHYGQSHCCWKCFSSTVIHTATPSETQLLDPELGEALRESPAYEICHLKNWCKPPVNLSNLPHIIEQYGSYECADVRDKVYGLLGLVQDGQRFPVNYEASEIDLVVNAALFCPSGDGALDQHTAFVRAERPVASILERLICPPSHTKVYTSWDISAIPEPAPISWSINLKFIAELQSESERETSAAQVPPTKRWKSDTGGIYDPPPEPDDFDDAI